MGVSRRPYESVSLSGTHVEVAGQMGIFPATQIESRSCCPWQDSNQLQRLPVGVDAEAVGARVLRAAERGRR